MQTSWVHTDQLGADAVGGLEGAEVEEVVVAPVLGLRVLLVRVVHVQQRQVVPCARQAADSITAQ